MSELVIVDFWADYGLETESLLNSEIFDSQLVEKAMSKMGYHVHERGVWENGSGNWATCDQLMEGN